MTKDPYSLGEVSGQKERETYSHISIMHFQGLPETGPKAREQEVQLMI